MSDDYQFALAVGACIGHGAAEFEVLRVLGQGGFGVTYLARDRRLMREVAIKEYFPSQFAGRSQGHTVLPASRAVEQTFGWGKARFLDEARLLADNRHPSLLNVIDYFEANGTAYMVMPFIAGDTLTSRINKAPLSEAETKRLLFGLQPGLSELHAKGVLHRDIKPSNIVIRPDGTPVLIDFGSARQAMGQQGNGLTKIVSEPFSPREQYASEMPQTAATDVYALAATLHCALLAAGPPSAVDRGENGKLPLLDEAVRQGKVSAHFARVLARAMASRPADRYVSVADFAKAAAAEAPAESAVSPSAAAGPAAPGGVGIAAPSARARGPLRSKSLFLAAGGFALVLALMVAGLLWHETAPADHAANAAELVRPTECDLLATHPDAPRLPGIAGVAIGAIDAGRAIPACRAAVARFPAEPAFRIWLARALRAADPDDPEAMVLLKQAETSSPGLVNTLIGFNLEQGTSGAVRDTEQAAIRFRRGCEAGYFAACNELGRLSRDDRGALPVGAVAAGVMRDGCNGGSGLACVTLGVLRDRGLLSNEAGEQMPADLFSRACSLGEMWGCTDLGRYYRALEGGLLRNYARAAELFRKACQGNNAAGCVDLGGMQDAGQIGGRADRVGAAQSYRRACQLGLQEACRK